MFTLIICCSEDLKWQLEETEAKILYAAVELRENVVSALRENTNVKVRSNKFLNPELSVSGLDEMKHFS